MEKVAGLLEVSLTEDAGSIALRVLDWRPEDDGAARTDLSARQARYLASLLLLKAEDAEEASERLNAGASVR